MFTIKRFLYDLKEPFEKIDQFRDKVLFILIKPYWPRRITPNQITILRIVIAIFLFIILFFYKNENKLLIISLFCIGAFTDLLDGSVARGLDKVTNIGAMLDPAADRILILPIAVYSLFSGHKWLLLFLLILEIINALVSIWGHGKNIFIVSNIFGKMKMFLQSLVFAVILVFFPQEPNLFFIYILWISAIFLVAGIYFKILEIRDASPSS